MKKILISLLFSTLLGLSYGQSVGVVLSGGGAKGMYHIGILKALEENNIPIDYIGGTSIGSIIGGMYAAGYSPEEIEQIFSQKDVMYWVMGKMDPQYKFNFTAPAYRPEMFHLNLDFKKKNNQKNDALDYTPIGKTKNIVSSLISSSQLNIGLNEYLASASAKAENNFDSLFVPFLCVSADITNREQFIWRKGNLPLAARASMAIPIVYSPIIIDSTIMVDGGVYNNFPWKEMDEAFSPDILIGGRCVSGKAPDVSNVPGQIMMLMTQPTDYDLPEDRGVMIGRDVNVGILDFEKVQETAEQGYADAMAQMEEIKERITRRTDPVELYNQRLHFRKDAPVLTFSEEVIDNLMKVEIDTLKPRVEKREAKENAKDANGVYNYNEFKQAFYLMLSQNDESPDFPIMNYDKAKGLYDINVKLLPKSLFFLRGGLNISSSTINQAYLGLAYRGKGSATIEGDVYVGSFYNSGQVAMRNNFYNRKHKFYVYSTLTYNLNDLGKANNQRISYRNDANLYKYVANDLYASTTVGIPISKVQKVEARLSVGLDWLNYFISDKFTTADRPNRTNLLYSNLAITLMRNNLNHFYYPTRGIRQEISISGTLAKEGYKGGTAEPTFGADIRISTNRAWGGIKYSRDEYFRFGKHFSFGYELWASLTSVREMQNDFSFRWVVPHFAPTAFSKTLFISEFQNQSSWAVGLKPIFELNEKIYLKTEAYVYHNNMFKYNDFFNNLKYIVAATAVYQSPIGPISLSYNYFSVSSIKRNYLLLNIGVMYFNKKGITY